MPKGTPGGKRVAWDESNKTKLFTAIVECCKIENIPWAEVAAATGIEGVTAVACQLQYQKVKKAANGGESSRAATPTTPKTPKPVTQRKTKTKAVATGSDDDDDDDDEVSEPVTPSKTPVSKKRTPAAKKVKAVVEKAEEADDDEEEEEEQKPKPKPKSPVKKPTATPKKTKTPALTAENHDNNDEEEQVEEKPKTPSKNRAKSVPMVVIPTPSSEPETPKKTPKRAKSVAVTDDEGSKTPAKKIKTDGSWNAVNDGEKVVKVEVRAEIEDGLKEEDDENEV